MAATLVESQWTLDKTRCPAPLVNEGDFAVATAVLEV